MADTQDVFLIDGTGFLGASQKSFLGAQLLVVDGEDQTFLFGVIRDLLRLRQMLGINRGIFVVGEEAHEVTTEVNVEKTIVFLKQLGVAVVQDSHIRVLDLCVALAKLVTHFVTYDRSLVQLAKGSHRVILLGKEDIEVLTSETVISRFDVTPDLVPAFLALTSGPAHTVLTKREAIAVLQQPGDLASKIGDSSLLSSRLIRNKLKANGDVILRRLKQLSPSGRCPSLHIDPNQLEVDIDNNDNRWLLTAHAFHSLKRLLPRPTKVPPAPQATKQRSPNYHVIETEADLQRIVEELKTSQCCALDTESSGKDPILQSYSVCRLPASMAKRSISPRWSRTLRVFRVAGQWLFSGIYLKAPSRFSGTTSNTTTFC